MGKTWTKSEIISYNEFSQAYIGFITKNNGWLVLCGMPAMGSECSYIYLTNDGGKTWTQIGNSNASDARVLTGAGFSDNKTGLLCFRFETSQLNICSTQDGGKTWAKLDISVPKGFEEYYSATPLSPVFNGSKGQLPIQLKNKNDQTKTIYFSSDDGGRSWTYAQN